jgi:hypothetical protein
MALALIYVDFCPARLYNWAMAQDPQRAPVEQAPCDRMHDAIDTPSPQTSRRRMLLLLKERGPLATFLALIALAFCLLPVPYKLLPLGALLLLVVWLGPKWQVLRSEGLNSENRFDRENEARKTIAQTIGGSLVIATLYGTEQTLFLQREGQFADRFTKAVEQLGASDSNGEHRVDVRLGGVLALEQLARVSEMDRLPILRLLTTYVRGNRPKLLLGAAVGNEEYDPGPPSSEIQEILYVLRRRSVELGAGAFIDLSGSTLWYADLQDGRLENAKLQRTQLNHAYLERAQLHRAKLWEAQLVGAHLSNSDLRCADLFEANLKGAELVGAHLEGANLWKATIDPSQIRVAHTDQHTVLPDGSGSRSSCLN